MSVRLRHVAVLAGEFSACVEELRSSLGLGAPWTEDPVAPTFGVRNAVFAVGDCFVEVISPLSPDSPAARHLEKVGHDCGYMVMFQVSDAAAARERASAAGVRIVWTLDLPDMSGTHLHPADLPGSIVAVEEARPPETWRWAGPEWTGRTPIPAPGALLGATVEVAEPGRAHEQWAGVLGVDTVPGIDFRRGDRGLVEVSLGRPADAARGRSAVEVAGVRFVLQAWEDEARPTADTFFKSD